MDYIKFQSISCWVIYENLPISVQLYRNGKIQYLSEQKILKTEYITELKAKNIFENIKKSDFNKYPLNYQDPELSVCDANLDSLSVSIDGKIKTVNWQGNPPANMYFLKVLQILEKKLNKSQNENDEKYDSREE